MDVIDANEAQAAGAVSTDLANQFPTVVDPLEDSIRLGRIAFAAQRLTSPPGDNAFERFHLALRIEPRSKQAKQGIADIAKKYIDYAEKNLAGGDTAQFDQYLRRAADVDKVVPDDADTPRSTAALKPPRHRQGQGGRDRQANRQSARARLTATRATVSNMSPRSASRGLRSATNSPPARQALNSSSSTVRSRWRGTT